MNEIIEVKRGDGTQSKIIVGNVIDSLEQFLPQRRIIIITDANVHRRYTALINRFEHIIIGMGETNKTLVTIESIYHQLIEMGADRETFIIGFGGGIVTDVAGFVASTYMRGLHFGFIASTLLSQVDASVGGKNGVNVEGYKNMVGTFNQPDFVLCDTSLLKTLPDRELRAGLAEIIKSAVIADPALFELFEQHTFADFKSDTALLTRAITAAIRVKVTIVEADERERGERKKLNLGHTFAHAIEKCSQDFLHGEAVAIGLVMICRLAEKMGVCSGSDAQRINNIITSYGLPTTSKIEVKRLLKALRLDKKRERESINIILPQSVGRCEIHKLSFAELEKFY